MLHTMFFLTSLILLLSSSVIQAAKYPAESEPRLIGGQEAEPFSHPYMVSLQRRFIWLRVHICGATILNEYWILTAAHCVTESFFTRWFPLEAVAGAHDNYVLGPNAQVRRIYKKVPHPSYKGGIGSHDIAMLRTLKPFSFTQEVQPISLPNDLKLDQDKLSIPGWGVLGTNMFMLDVPETLQEVEVMILPYDDCYKAIEEIKDEDETNPLDEEANICTGPITGGVAACSGDSGGPLVLSVNKNKESNDTIDYDYNEGVSVDSYTENSKSIIVGVVSWGMMPCGEVGAPTVYTNVSTYLDFILKHMKT